MTILRGKFVVDVYYHGKQFTPQQILDCITSTDKNEFADFEEIKTLIKQSSAELQKIIKEANLKMDQVLDNSSSVGKKIAELLLKNCDETINLMVKHGGGRGARL